MGSMHNNERLLSMIQNAEQLALMAKAASGASAAPLSRTAFIDGGTLQTSHTGSIAFPYGTISAWLASIAAGVSAADSQALRLGLVSPSLAGYVENLAIPAYKNVQINCLGFTQSVTGNVTWANVAGGGAVAPTTSAMLDLHNIAISGNVTITDDAVSSIVLISGDELPAAAVGGNIDTHLATHVALIGLFDCTVTGNITSTANATGAAVQVVNAVVNGLVTAQSVIGLDSTFGGGVTVATGAGGTSSFRNCNISGLVTGGAGTIITMDGNTWRLFQENGGSIAGGATILVIGGSQGGLVEGANLTNADVTVSLNGTGATAGFTAGGNHYTLPAATLGAAHVVTLGIAGALPGDTIEITRQDATANTYTIKDDAGTTLAVLPVSTRGFFRGRFNGAHFVMEQAGSGA